MNSQSRTMVYQVIVIDPQIAEQIDDRVGFSMMVASNHFVNLLAYHTYIDGPLLTWADSNFQGDWHGLHNAIETASPGDPILVFVHHSKPLSNPVDWLRLMSVTNGKCFSFDRVIAMHSRDSCAISAIGMVDSFK